MAEPPHNSRQPAPGSRGPGLDLDGLRRLARLPAGEALRRGPDRETFFWRTPAGERVIVKRYRGGRPLEAWRERFQGRPGRSPARREYENLQALAALGLPVPRALACHEEGSLSLVVMECFTPLVSLRERLSAEPAQARALALPLLELVARFHGAGWYHRDLYLDHLVLVGRPERLALIDLERARRDRRPRPRWFVKDMAALWHSTPPGVEPRLAARFLRTWLDRRGVRGRRERRRWFRAIRSKARRMAAHVPRGGTSLPSGCA